jgi:hypothetical protein
MDCIALLIEFFFVVDYFKNIYLLLKEIYNKIPKRKKGEFLGGISLNQAIKLNKYKEIKDKLMAVEKNIVTLDVVDKKFKNIHTLLLSNNRISNLRHIGQFPYLSVLSMAFNQINSINSLEPLHTCTKLTNINLSHNQVSEMPYYRLHLIFLCPSLKTIDNVDITSDERAMVMTVMNKESEVLKIMFNNDIAIRRLEIVELRLQVHLELMKMLHNTLVNASTSLSFSFSVDEDGLLGRCSGRSLKDVLRYSFRSVDYMLTSVCMFILLLLLLLSV